MTERAFTTMVIELAQLYRWRVAHFRPGMNRRGKWATAVQGDGAGFPDLILVRQKPSPHYLPHIVAAELKVPPNRPTAEQLAWLAALEAAGVPAFVWTPDDWNFIRSTLA